MSESEYRKSKQIRRGSSKLHGFELFFLFSATVSDLVIRVPELNRHGWKE
jgi:hypothetical protein